MLASSHTNYGAQQQENRKVLSSKVKEKQKESKKVYEQNTGRGGCEQMQNMSQNSSRRTGMQSREKWERKRLRMCIRQSAGRPWSV